MASAISEGNKRQAHRDWIRFDLSQLGPKRLRINFDGLNILHDIISCFWNQAIVLVNERRFARVLRRVFRKAFHKAFRKDLRKSFWVMEACGIAAAACSSNWVNVMMSAMMNVMVNVIIKGTMYPCFYKVYIYIYISV